MKKKIRGQSSWLRVFYYSHPYLVIFNALIIYNLALIALAAWLMTFLMKDVDGSLGYTWQAYLNNLEYCTVFTMNNGGIYAEVPNSVVILKIVLSVTQMITFTGSLVGLATSMLQGVFDRRAHNVGRLKLKNHYIILNWSSVAPNLIRELSFTPERKIVVVLSKHDNDEINEQIDNIFLDTGTEKKNITIFVKNGNPGSKKALKEISISKAKSIALLVDEETAGASSAPDVDTFKLLMSIIGTTKSASIAVEAVDEEAVRSMEQLIKASPELQELSLTVFSKASVVGHILARSAINSSYADLYYSMLTYQNGTFYEFSSKQSLSEAMTKFNDCIPVSKYNTPSGARLFGLASSPIKLRQRLFAKKYKTEAPFREKLITNNFSLYIIGENERTTSILEEVSGYTKVAKGRIDVKVYPFDCDVDKLLDEMASTKKRKKILILSDEKANSDSIDVNVFMTLLKLKASHKLSSDIEISAELLDQSNRSSLAALNVTNVIISNQMVALYLVQLMTHPDNTAFYEGMLSKKSDYNASDVDITRRYAEEILDLEKEVTFTSRGEFIASIYEASHHKYIPIGFVGEKEEVGLAKSVTNVVTNVVGKTINSFVNVTKKAITSMTDMGAALNIDEAGQAEVQLDVNSRIMLLSSHLAKKENITLEKGMILVLIHNPSTGE